MSNIQVQSSKAVKVFEKQQFLTLKKKYAELFNH